MVKGGRMVSQIWLAVCDIYIPPESLLHSLEQVVDGIGLHVNAMKTEYMCFDQKGYISTLNGVQLPR